jgi:hypothetical protein
MMMMMWEIGFLETVIGILLTRNIPGNECVRVGECCRCETTNDRKCISSNESDARREFDGPNGCIGKGTRFSPLQMRERFESNCGESIVFLKVVRLNDYDRPRKSEVDKKAAEKCGCSNNGKK